MERKLSSTWMAHHQAHNAEIDAERWSPLAALMLATMMSLVLWALIIRGLMRVF